MPPYDTASNLSALPRISVASSSWAVAELLPLLTAAIVSSIAASLTFLHFATVLDSVHFGLMYKTALDLAHGAVPYRETLVVYGILTAYLQAFALFLFGDRQLSLGLVTALCYGATVFSLFLLWRQFLSSWHAVLATGLFALVAPRAVLPWANYFALLFATVAALCVLRAINVESYRRWSFLAGLCCAAVFLTRQQEGPFVAALLGIVMFFEVRHSQGTRRALIAFCNFLAGLLLPLIAFLAWLKAAGTFNDWLLQSVTIVPKYFSPTFSLPSHPVLLAESVLRVLFNVVWIVPIASVILVCSIIALVPRRRWPALGVNPALMLTAAVALAGWPQAYPLGDEFRFEAGLAPAFGLIVWAVTRVPSVLRRPSILALSVLLAVSFRSVIKTNIVAIIASAQAVLAVGESIPPSLPEVFSGMTLRSDQASFYGTVAAAIQSYEAGHPEAGIVTTIGDPYLLCLGAYHKPAHPFFVVWPSISWFTHTPLESHSFADDTANVLMYPDYWHRIGKYITDHQPIVIGTGATNIPGYRVLAAATVPNPYYFYHSQFGGGDKLYVFVPVD